LQLRVDRRADAALLRLRFAQAFCQQCGFQWRRQCARGDAFDSRVGNIHGAPHMQVAHARQHLVARHLCGGRFAIRPQSARALRQHREQCRFGATQAISRLAEVGVARGLHALDRAAERRVVQIQREDFTLRQMRFELQCTEYLLDLAVQRARVRIDDARDLHRQRRAARNRFAIADHLPDRTRERERIDAGMFPEPAVLVAEQRLDIQRRNLLRRHRISPDGIGVRECAQRRAVAGEDDRAAAGRIR